jgi:hypothetical protein
VPDVFPRKPLHQFAIALWAAALVFLAVEPLVAGSLYEDAVRASYGSAGEKTRHATDLYWIWVRSRDAVLRAFGLAAAGFVVELLDQVRWGLLPPDSREAIARRRAGGALNRLRTPGVGGDDEASSS